VRVTWVADRYGFLSWLWPCGRDWEDEAETEAKAKAI